MPQYHVDPLISEFSSDPDMIVIVEMFIRDIPKRVAAIQKAYAEEDRDTFILLTQHLFEAAGGYGFPSISLAAQDLQYNAESRGDLSTLTSEFGKLVELCGRVRSSCQAHYR